MKRAMIVALGCAVGVVGACGRFATKEKARKIKQTDMQLAGQWSDGCVAHDWLGLTRSGETLTMSGVGDFDRKRTLFSDEQCTKSEVEFLVRGTFDTLGKDRTVEGAKDINFTVVFAQVTPRSDAVVKTLNAMAYCGVSDWQVAQAVDILGRDCLGQRWDNGTVDFDIYRLENDKKRLLLGKKGMFFESREASSRPTEMDEQKPYALK